MIRTIDELRPDARAVAQGFLDAATGAARRGRRAELRAELSAHLCERLAPDASRAEVEQVVAGLGSDDRGGRPRAGWPSGLRPRGVFDRIADTWWRPSDPRLLLPRAIGLGWDVNLGAVAVRLKLIEPDAEAVPFASTPDAAFRVAAVVPVVMAGATVLHYLVRGRSLPPRLASHWDAAGRPDRWVPKGRAALVDIALTAGGAVLAGWAFAADRPGPTRAGALAGATMAGSLGAGIAVARPLRGGPWLMPSLLGQLGAGVGGVLLGLARAGRRAEVGRDLAVQRHG